MADIISAGFFGFLLGAIIVIVCLAKDIDRAWDKGFEAGEQYGAVSERILQALGEKERVAFSKLVDYMTWEAHREVKQDA